jgi:hypothetical protein
MWVEFETCCNPFPGHRVFGNKDKIHFDDGRIEKLPDIRRV